MVADNPRLKIPKRRRAAQVAGTPRKPMVDFEARSKAPGEIGLTSSEKVIGAYAEDAKGGDGPIQVRLRVKRLDYEQNEAASESEMLDAAGLACAEAAGRHDIKLTHPKSVCVIYVFEDGDEEGEHPWLRMTVPTWKLVMRLQFSVKWQPTLYGRRGITTDAYDTREQAVAAAQAVLDRARADGVEVPVDAKPGAFAVRVDRAPPVEISSPLPAR